MAADGLEMISMTEVAKHNTLEDFWTVIHGKVYDLSDFILEHPGGSAIVKPYAGKVRHGLHRQCASAISTLSALFPAYSQVFSHL